MVSFDETLCTLQRKLCCVDQFCDKESIRNTSVAAIVHPTTEHRYAQICKWMVAVALSTPKTHPDTS
eukprot:301774-Karenia_brevis.AAC.1